MLLEDGHAWPSNTLLVTEWYVQTTVNFAK
jgi:hypothetical protein